MEQRVMCSTPGCSNTILPATAARTGGICRPCEQRRARAEHEAYVQEHRSIVDPFAGISDPVQLITRIFRPGPRDELVVEMPYTGDVSELLASLSRDDLTRLINVANEDLAEGRTDEAEDIARSLAALTTHDLSPLQGRWAALRHFYPGIVFRGADPGVRELALQAVESDRFNRNHALVALAWIGDRRVRELFASWRDHPPPWSATLYVAPDGYTTSAGWELRNDAERRVLFSDLAFALVPSSDGDAPSPVDVIRPYDAHCGFCDSPLTTLLGFDSAELRLESVGTPERVVTCRACCCPGPLFMRLDDGGAAHWHEANELPESASTAPGLPWIPSYRLVLGGRRNPLHAAEVFLPTTFSQVGGAPGWIHDAEYPECPDCRRTMPFVGQIAGDEVDEDGDGMYYAHWCSRCRITATVYQQT